MRGLGARPTLACMTATAHGLPTGRWVLDPVHSSVSFAVAHAGVTLVWGRFSRVAGELSVPPEGPALVSAAVEVASLDTGSADRDAQLLGPAFFHAAAHPRMTFRSSHVRAGRGNGLSIAGRLAVRDVTRPLVLEGAVAGVELDPDGDTRLGLRVEGSLSRSAYGMTENEVLHSGQVLIADRVQLRLDVSAIRRG